jgi:hydrogenase maturation factor
MYNCENGEACVTCSDQATPAEVLRLDAQGMALARVGEVVKSISVALVDVKVGGTVLVHAGEAIGVMAENGANG